MSTSELAPRPDIGELAPGASVSNLFLDPHGDEPIRAELYGLERLEGQARHLAAHTVNAKVVPGHPLLYSFHRNRRALIEAHRQISAAYQRKEAFEGDAEWLLDNYYIVADVLHEISTDLPSGYYNLLPKIVHGPLAGYPRVYALALDLIAHCDSSLDETHVNHYVEAFQRVTPLTIGELWAVPIMFRLVLMDNLRRLAEHILRVRADRSEAKNWATRCLPPLAALAQRRPPLPKPQADWSHSFIVQLLDLLHDPEAASSERVEWLETCLTERGLTATEVMRRERQRQAANQVSIGNCVTSLRLLSVLDWSAFFERSSQVEAILREDPAQVYANQDFATRDRYRRIVEKLARGSKLNECDVARHAIELAQQGAEHRHHVGYYLIDHGRLDLEALLHYQPTASDRLHRFILRHPKTLYFGGVAVVTLVALAALIAYVVLIEGTTEVPGVLLLLAFVSLLPASELAVALINTLVSKVLWPRVLPKLFYKEGIPADCTTFVVMPTMLVRQGSGAALRERLELHYLSNSDPQLRFALLTDFADAPAEHMPEDDRYLRAAVEHIQALNDRYCSNGPERFFLLHRKRQWNPVQGCWMGWERKRGKLSEFNRLLRGARDTSFTTITSGFDKTPKIRFVITLDADTQLPRETAQRLIATLAHPLNQPRFDPAKQRVVHGYGVLQPRVSMTLTGSRKSQFARIFGGSAGIDPYTSAVSDVYQDLFGLGSFTGKGIYDVDGFEAAVGHTFPENHILSHDLIEGNYARCGLATDIELLDDFPALYPAYARREHRWARGDWQILPWLFPRVPGPDNRRRANPLPVVERWKVFDNLRRTLVPPALVLMLILGWTILPGWSWLLTLTALAIPAWPLLLQLCGIPGRLLHSMRDGVRLSIATGTLGNTAGQVLLAIAFLPDRAWQMVDAVGRTLLRVYVTRRNLLEWETAAATERRMNGGFQTYIRSMWFGPVLAVVLGVGLSLWDPLALVTALPVLFAWLVSPAIAFWISKPFVATEPALTAAERTELRLLARRTWSFFETFVGEEDHFLPPDNFQEDPKGEIAHRTSPTNIGLYLLSGLAAHDFGYLSLRDLVERMEKTFQTLDQMEQSHGHLLNWYDTRTLKPLQPTYLSTVDSGNFMASLLAFKQGLREKVTELVPAPQLRQGLLDVLDLVLQTLRSLEPAPTAGDAPPPVDAAESPEVLAQLVLKLRALVEQEPGDLLSWETWIERIEHGVTDLRAKVQSFGQIMEEVPEDLRHWARLFGNQLRECRADLVELAPWLELLRLPPPACAAAVATVPPGTGEETPFALRWRSVHQRLVLPFRISDFPEAADAVAAELTSLAEQTTDVPTQTWLLAVKQAVGKSTATALRDRCFALADRAGSLVRGMDFKILYNEARHLFAVGYNLSAGRLDNSHYDLLASEACVASFLAVARGDVPKKHWFQLGRPMTSVPGSVALLSWGGTMFEYLMPRLLLPSFPGTLLTESQDGAVGRQIQYGRECHSPWGISESAFSSIDVNQNYQYQAFGVPGLGLKRGLAKDLVIAPYATALAVMVRPRAAAHNLRRLVLEGAAGLYGFYDAIDYTADRLPPKRRCVVVKCFMAHHQGMSLVALANCLLNNPMPRRFHAEPMVRATELLLQERVAEGVPLLTPNTDETVLSPSSQETVFPMSRRLTTPYTAHPRIQLLSSGRYTVMVTNAGSGRSIYQGQDVSRWREDRTCDAWGQFCYVRDLRSDMLWSAGHQPICRDADDYEVLYSTDKAEYRRVDGHIETRMEVTVSPESHAEIRRVMLTNHDTRNHDVELTSYLEVVLGPHGGDLAHPAFAKLFLETEYVPAETALLCRRRPRSPDQKPIWAVHVLAVEGADKVGEVQFETDRGRFLGRGRTPANPAALERGAALSGTTGSVLDPILSLRCRVRIAPESSVGVAFTTVVAESREEAMSLADHYHDFHGVTRGFELAWAHSQVELRHFHLTAQEVHLYLRLAAYIFYAGPPLRAPTAVLKSNRLGQPGLWGHGISGDNPIVLVRIEQAEQIEIVRQLLAAHAYWRIKGLEVDLVILNEHQAGYFEDLQQQVLDLVRTSDDRGLVDKPGGVFLRKATHMPPEDKVLLQSAARCVLTGSRGPLANQLDRLERQATPPLPQPLQRRGDAYSQKGSPSRGAAATPVAPWGPKSQNRRDWQQQVAGGVQAPKDLLFPNGLGGFTPDGREYVIGGGNGKQAGFAFPPAPWINVVANPSCGFLVSEAGAGFTWFGNSQLNRLTPWNNDPVSDRPSEVVYLRDEATDEVWTPTPLPLAGRGPYVVRHGQGYTVFEHTSHGLAQELCLFVPVADPVKLICLKLRNLGREPRKLSTTFYAEWVLGTVRDQAPMQVITEVDRDTGALLARNAFNADYPTYVAFADVNARTRSVTADRTEFLGRNGALNRPAALDRPKLSGAAGAEFDPCAALQTVIELQPGEEKLVVFLLGEAANVEEVRRLVTQYRDPGRVAAALKETKAQWDQILNAVQVRTPNQGLDLMVNRWLLYQVTSCRLWGRSALYQSGGAFGFRDQLQDVMALVYAKPRETRDQILRAAARQFPEGDVQHWWHPPRGAGVRTRCSDDFLWLPYVVCHYLAATGDAALLDERVPFLHAPELRLEQDEDYRVPEVSDEVGTVYEHCVRAVEHGLRFGVHGLPLMGTGDWNDGMNLVGKAGKGESVWNGWFLLPILRDVADLAEARGDGERAAKYRDHAERVRQAIEEHAWDGAWYRRAYYDDGTPMGSNEDDECKIDSLAQSWAVLSGGGNADRTRQAMAAAEEQLVRAQDKLILLFTPPFDSKTKQEPGYIKGYVPGIRENGGQYTHGAAWFVRATAQLGKGTHAMELFDLLNPIQHGSSPEEIKRYRTEPYVLAGDVYSQPPHTGRGGWTWYTGSASWLYRTALETQLGFQPRGNQLTLAPCIPASWPHFEITYRFGSAVYLIRVDNPNKVERGVQRVRLDGKTLEKAVIELVDDGKQHVVEVTMG